MSGRDRLAEPRPEAVAAARWWADQLGRATHDLGQRDPSARERAAFANTMTRLADRHFTGAQREAFRTWLAWRIEAHLRKWEQGSFAGSWRPEEPQWGSYYRVVAHDYRPAEVLEDAAAQAGFQLRMTDLPMKTTMWINPGEVKVAKGHGAPIEIVWSAP